MGLFGAIKRLFVKPKQARNYAAVASVGGVNGDWSVNAQTQDADVWENNYTLRQRCRELFDTDPFFRKYRDELYANVPGENGISLRMRVKEEADRTVYTEEEKAALLGFDEKRADLAKWISKRTGKKVSHAKIYDKSKGVVKAGAPDVYACQLIERKWKEWQRAEYATPSGRFSYNEIRQLRLLAAARDGDCFIRLIRDPKINKFGFAVQLIHAEWCDYNLNQNAAAGRNEIRMGIELNAWGKAVAYHFIERQAGDWQYAPPGGYFLQGGQKHTTVSAGEIIHYARQDYSDNTRPAPWAASIIFPARQLKEYTDAAVVAARAGACQMGFVESSVNPEGGQLDGQPPDPSKVFNTAQMAPGMIIGLPFGTTYKTNNPDNPNSQFGPFRKDILRHMCAGLPGANYNVQANDFESANYSSARVAMLDERELWKLLQRFDIDKAERPIFEAWLEMALMVGEIPLPLQKFDKFNKPHFSGRRWQWVDPKNEALAQEAELKNMLTSWTRIFEEKGWDLEEVWEERAHEMKIAEFYGIELPTWDKPEPVAETEEEEEAEPKKAPVNGKHFEALARN